jgi:hypothetical protein
VYLQQIVLVFKADPHQLTFSSAISERLADGFDLYAIETRLKRSWRDWRYSEETAEALKIVSNAEGQCRDSIRNRKRTIYGRFILYRGPFPR